MSSLAQKDQAREVANAHRLQQASFRAQAKQGQADFRTLLADPPDWAQNLVLFDLLKLAPGMGRYQLERIGFRAVDANVNLAVRVGRSSERSRLWLTGQIAGVPSRVRKRVPA